MATFAQIKEVRLTISDPPGFIDFVEVANFAALPVSPVAQTAYKTTDTESYWYHNGTAYVTVELMVSDTDIGTWVDAFGINGAVRKSVERILATLPARMMIVKNSDGAESTEFAKLLDLQKFYQGWIDRLTPPETASNSGVYLKTKKPCIAGGNV